MDRFWENPHNPQDNDDFDIDDDVKNRAIYCPRCHSDDTMLKHYHVDENDVPEGERRECFACGHLFSIFN
jgi:DNA-directed RNA polymerase subunit M/transcription elongation factor TFIIS